MEIEYQFLRYETLASGRVVRILLNRPQTRNAQHRGLLVELDQAFRRAEADDEVRVVILGGEGSSFSSGHDTGSREAVDEASEGPAQHPSMRVHGGRRLGPEQRMLQEWHYYFENTRYWRDLRKITIAQVHGPVYAAGLMLAWCCDLIVAAEGTTFADIVAARMGMAGVEYFAHPWELGPRKAKELLLTGDSIDADEAHRIGMVNKVFPADQLSELTLVLAERIAAVPTMASLLVKDAVNQTLDTMGFTTALRSAFTSHQLNHAYWATVNDDRFPAAPVDPGAPRPGRPRPAVKDAPISPDVS